LTELLVVGVDGMMPPMSNTPSWLAAARDHWQWRGQARPPFAADPGPGQESVWDFPRPPALAPDGREVVVTWGDVEVLRTRRAIRVLETAHPPTFYLPWADADRSLFEAAPGSSFCEWKGPARYWSLQHAGRRLARVGWSYPQPLAGAEALADCLALYAWPDLHCTVGGEVAQPQPGGFYGGWVTPDLAGPFKGDPGSTGW
jgi:uncharacterized protein (DUF427 family)